MLDIGKKGEQIAKQYLLDKGLSFRAANIRVPGGEIDLLMYDPITKELIFVEVKTRSSTSFGTAADSITPNKTATTKRAIEYYVTANKWAHDYRFDVICIQYSVSECKIEHYEYVELG